jgi:hypothetical protein
MRIYAFNAPPSSGKDVCATFLQTRHNFKLVRLAQPLYSLITQIYSISMEDWLVLVETSKNEPSHKLRGKSPRSAMIHMAETVIKPHFGAHHFINIAIDEINKNQDRDIVIPDLGFNVELSRIVDIFGKAAVHIIRIDSNLALDIYDARNTISMAGVRETTLVNRTSIHDMLTQLNNLVDNHAS